MMMLEKEWMTVNLDKTMHKCIYQGSSFWRGVGVDVGNPPHEPRPPTRQRDEMHMNFDHLGVKFIIFKIHLLYACVPFHTLPYL